MRISVMQLYRYPVKGLSAEPLQQVMLKPYDCVPHDRRFALAHATTKFDVDRPEWMAKTNFIMLMRDEKLALLQTGFEEQSGVLTIKRNGELLLAARITDPEGRQAVAQFFANFLGSSVSGTLQPIEAPGHSFSDAKQKPNARGYKYISVINLASIRALEEVVGTSLDPIRFRANVYIDGLAPWAEFDWVGSHVTAGDVQLHIVSRIVRCAATTVNPATAKRDVNIPIILQQSFGHGHMGVYGEVVHGGKLAIGDPVSVIER